MSIVQAQALVKRYTPTGPNAVDKVSFEIHAGEIFGLLGPNGAGKTTIISMLSTLIPPTEGDALICGHSIRKAPMAVRRVVGVIPETIALYEDLSAWENLSFWGQMQGLSGAELRRQVDGYLERTGLAERRNDRVKTFSGGMKRRLNIAAGLLGLPKLVLMDEPTVGIDPQSRRYILDWVKEMNQQGLTVLYTTHYMEEAQELSHRIGIIDHGQLIAQGTLTELRRLIGEHKTLFLKLNQDGGAEEIANRLQGATGIARVSADGGELTLNVESTEVALPVILNVAAGLGLGLRTIEIREPNLEAVFLHLTGRALRD